MPNYIEWKKAHPSPEGSGIEVLLRRRLTAFEQAIIDCVAESQTSLEAHDQGQASPPSEPPSHDSEQP